MVFLKRFHVIQTTEYNQTLSFSAKWQNSTVFSTDLFFHNFFSRVSAVFSMNSYVLFRYLSILISFNVLVHQVNVTEIDVSAKIELWQRSISHDRSKLNICIFQD